MKTLRRDVLGLLAAWLLAPSGAPAAAFDLAQLMALLAARKSGEANFSEQRFVQGLDAPLPASGVLGFVAPDRLMRRTLQPRAEAMLVDGNTLTLTRNGRTRSFALDATPEMVALVEAMRGTLSGNASTLERHFRIALDGDAQRWMLELTPLEDALARQVLSVRLGGRAGELLSVELLLTGGDRSVMTIEPVRGATAAASAP